MKKCWVRLRISVKEGRGRGRRGFVIGVLDGRVDFIVFLFCFRFRCFDFDREGCLSAVEELSFRIRTDDDDEPSISESTFLVVLPCPDSLPPPIIRVLTQFKRNNVFSASLLSGLPDEDDDEDEDATLSSIVIMIYRC